MVKGRSTVTNSSGRNSGVGLALKGRIANPNQSKPIKKSQHLAKQRGPNYPPGHTPQGRTRRNLTSIQEPMTVQAPAPGKGQAQAIKLGAHLGTSWRVLLLLSLFCAGTSGDSGDTA